MIDRKLEIFRMAAMVGNFTEAAAALGMSQPNVTHQLARLEKAPRLRSLQNESEHFKYRTAPRRIADCFEKLLKKNRIAV